MLGPQRRRDNRVNVAQPKTNAWILFLALVFALLIAALDFLPAIKGILPWHSFFVVPVIWIALWSAEDEVFPVTAIAVIVTVFVVSRGFLSFWSSTPIALVDRIVIISIIWLTVMLALLRKRARRTYRWINLAGKPR